MDTCNLHNAEVASQPSKAIPFIIFNQSEGFQLTPQAEEFLFSLNDETLSIVTVVGKYRTGKSFFINRVLLNNQSSESNKTQGFPVGPTVNPCTKGLWIWNRAINTGDITNSKNNNLQANVASSQQQQQSSQFLNSKLQSEQSSPYNQERDMKVLVIDTEGFGGIDERDKNRDLRIFLLSLLLSSYLIYNSMGPIDEIALQDMALIINLAKEVRLRAKSLLESEDIENYFPSLLWVLRDFSLQMTDKNGMQISAREYLENSLQLHKGISDKIEERNRIRKLIRHCFQDRDCISLSRPAEKETELQEMDKLDNSQLRSKFLSEIQHARQKIFKKMKPKIVNQKYVTGRIFLQLCKCFIQTINEGQIINIEHTWEIIMKSEAQKVLKESLVQIDTIFSEQSLQIQGQDQGQGPGQSQGSQGSRLQQYQQAHKVLSGEANFKIFREANVNGTGNSLCGQAFLNEESLKQMKVNIKKQLVEKFKKKTYGVDEEVREYVRILEEKVNQKFKEFKAKNRESLLRQCELLIQFEVEEVSKKISSGAYNNDYSGIFTSQTTNTNSKEKAENSKAGLQDFYEDLTNLKQQLNQKIGEVPEKFIIVNQIICSSSERLFKEFIQQREDLWNKQNICGKYRSETLLQQMEQWQLEKSTMQEKQFKLELENASLLNREQAYKENLDRLKKEQKAGIKQSLEDQDQSNQKIKSEISKTYQQEVQNLKSENQSLKQVVEDLMKKLKDVEGENNQLQIEKQKSQFQQTEPDSASQMNINKDLEKSLYESAQNIVNKQLNQQQQQLVLKEEMYQQQNQIVEKNQSQQKDTNSSVLLESVVDISELQTLVVQKNDNQDEKFKEVSSQASQSNNTMNNKKQKKKGGLISKDLVSENSVWVQAIYQKVTSEMRKEMNDIIQSNKNLTEALDKLEKRNTLLFQQNEQNKSLLSNTLNLQCAKCLQSFNINAFQSHIELCRVATINTSRSHSISQIVQPILPATAATSLIASVSSPSSQNLTVVGLNVETNSSLLEKFKNSQMKHCQPQGGNSCSTARLQTNVSNTLLDLKKQQQYLNNDLALQRIHQTPLRGISYSVHQQSSNSNQGVAQQQSGYQQTFSPNLLQQQVLGQSNSASGIKSKASQKIYSLQNTPNNKYLQNQLDSNQKTTQQYNNNEIWSELNNKNCCATNTGTSFIQQSNNYLPSSNISNNNISIISMNAQQNPPQGSASNIKCKEELEICIISSSLQRQQTSANSSSIEDNSYSNSCCNSYRNIASKADQTLNRFVLMYQIRTHQQQQGNFYTVWRSMKDIYDLHKSIKTLFPKIDINLEVCGPLVHDMNNNNDSNSLNEVSFQQRLEELTFGDLDRNSTIEERKSMMQAYLRELAKNYLVRNSTRFRRFLGILDTTTQQQQHQRKGCDKEKLIEIKRNLQRELASCSVQNQKTMPLTQQNEFQSGINNNNTSSNNNKILNLEPLNLVKKLNTQYSSQTQPQQQQVVQAKCNVIKENFKVENQTQRQQKQQASSQSQLSYQTKNNINASRQSLASIYGNGTNINNNNQLSINQNINNCVVENNNVRSIQSKSGIANKNKSISAHYVNIFDANTLFTETLETEVEKVQQNLNFSNLSTLPNNAEQINIYDPSFNDKSLLKIMRNSQQDKQFMMRKSQGLFTIHSRNSTPKKNQNN